MSHANPNEEYRCVHCGAVFFMFSHWTEHIMLDCKENRSGKSGFDRVQD